MILESIKADGSLLFHEVNAFMVRDDGSVQVRELDGNLLDIQDFTIYARLRLLTDHGKVMHTVRNDVPEPAALIKPMPEPAPFEDNVIEPEEWR